MDLKEKVLRAIPAIGVLNIVIMIMALITCVWADDIGFWLRLAATCIIVHCACVVIERGLE